MDTQAHKDLLTHKFDIATGTDHGTSLLLLFVWTVPDHLTSIRSKLFLVILPVLLA